MQNNFSNFEELNEHIQHKKKGSFVITYLNCKKYAGMALAIMIVYDVEQSKFELDLQWMSLGLDLYGDTLQESYLYEFENLKELLVYLQMKYNIKVTDIPVKFEFDASQFPDPIHNEDKKPIFETAWKQFRQDFKNNTFLDSSLKLIYDSNNY
jgi:hypothetical protein